MFNLVPARLRPTLFIFCHRNGTAVLRVKLAVPGRAEILSPATASLIKGFMNLAIYFGPKEYCQNNNGSNGTT